MATSTDNYDANRFINNNLRKLQEANNNPILDYETSPILTLEDAAQSIIHIVPGLADYVSRAKANCNRDSKLLTQDESAAIYLYSMPTSFYSSLNIALRSEARYMLKPWFAFLKLFITALEKLPSTKAVIWRGVSFDATLTLFENEVYTWWNISSCSTKINIVQDFLGESGTLFSIEASHGKDISSFSAVSDEHELILMPGTRVRVKSKSLNLIGCFFVVHLEEINPQR